MQTSLSRDMLLKELGRNETPKYIKYIRGSMSLQNLCPICRNYHTRYNFTTCPFTKIEKKIEYKK